MLVTAKIEGTAQNGTIRGLSVINILRQFETRAVRVIIEEIADPGEPGKEPNDQNKSPQ